MNSDADLAGSAASLAPSPAQAVIIFQLSPGIILSSSMVMAGGDGPRFSDQVQNGFFPNFIKMRPR